MMAMTPRYSSSNPPSDPSDGETWVSSSGESYIYPGHSWLCAIRPMTIDQIRVPIKNKDITCEDY
jgi:hypothetical protein